MITNILDILLFIVTNVRKKIQIKAQIFVYINNSTYICTTIQNKLNFSKMKTATLRAKVVAKLSKYNHDQIVEDMMNKHFEQASRLYSTPKSIFEFIVTVY